MQEQPQQALQSKIVWWWSLSSLSSTLPFAMPFPRLPLNGDMPLLLLRARGTTLLLSSIDHNKTSLVQSLELIAFLPMKQGGQSSRLLYSVGNESKHPDRLRCDTSLLSSPNHSLQILVSLELVKGHPCLPEAVPLPVMKFKMHVNTMVNKWLYFYNNTKR